MPGRCPGGCLAGSQPAPAADVEHSVAGQDLGSIEQVPVKAMHDRVVFILVVSPVLALVPVPCADLLRIRCYDRRHPLGDHVPPVFVLGDHQWLPPV